MNTVTTTAIRDAFVVAIHAITPTEESLRAIGWNYTPSPRVGGRAALQPGTRNFDLIFRDAVPSLEWVGGRGSAYKIELVIATSYAGVEPETCDGVDNDCDGAVDEDGDGDGVVAEVGHLEIAAQETAVGVGIVAHAPFALGRQLRQFGP